MATLMQMPIEHLPVLAGGADRPPGSAPGRDRRRPAPSAGRARAPGRRADRPRGHAHLRRPRSRPRTARSRTWQPRSNARRASSEPTSPRRSTSWSAKAHRRHRLHGPGHVLAPARRAGARLLLHATTRRSTCGWTRDQDLSAADLVNEWPEARLARISASYGEERYAGGDRPRDRPPAAAGDDRRPGRGDQGRGAARRTASGAATRRSAPSRRSGSPSTASSTCSTAPCPWPGSCFAIGGRFAAIAFHSLEDRRVKHFLADLARGCICPPELPVCQCGHEPEAELLTRRAVAPGAEEVERNPRSRSAHLRAARKLAAGEEAV